MFIKGRDYHERADGWRRQSLVFFEKELMRFVEVL